MENKGKAMSSDFFTNNMTEWREKLANWFAELQNRIKLDNKTGRTDINKMCEAMFIPILNMVYGWKLESCTIPNAPGYDLQDTTNHVVVQVTSDTSIDKVRKTILKTADTYTSAPVSLYMLYIGEPPPKHWNANTFHTPAWKHKYKYPHGKIVFHCPENLITYHVLLNKCCNDTDILGRVYSICQKYFTNNESATNKLLKDLLRTSEYQTKFLEQIRDRCGNKFLLAAQSGAQKYDEAFTAISSWADFLSHVDLVRSYCRQYMEGDIYRWRPICHMLNNQIRNSIVNSGNNIIRLKELLVTESDAYPKVQALDDWSHKVMTCADCLERITSNDAKSPGNIIKKTYEALDRYWKCAEELIQLIVQRTTNPEYSADLFRTLAG